MTKQQLTCRMETIREWDSRIRNHGGSEDPFIHWIVLGLPDGYSNWDLQEFAKSNKAFEELHQVYMECLEMMDEEDAIGRRRVS